MKCIKDNVGNMEIQLAMEHSWNTHMKKTQENGSIKALGTQPFFSFQTQARQNKKNSKHFFSPLPLSTRDKLSKIQNKRKTLCFWLTKENKLRRLSSLSSSFPFLCPPKRPPLWKKNRPFYKANGHVKSSFQPTCV